MCPKERAKVLSKSTAAFDSALRYFYGVVGLGSIVWSVLVDEGNLSQDGGTQTATFYRRKLLSTEPVACPNNMQNSFDEVYYGF